VKKKAILQLDDSQSQLDDLHILPWLQWVSGKVAAYNLPFRQKSSVRPLPSNDMALVVEHGMMADVLAAKTYCYIVHGGILAYPHKNHNMC